MSPKNTTKHSIDDSDTLSRKILCNLQNYLFSVDTDNHFIQVNNKALDLFSTPTENGLLGKNFKKFAVKLGWSQNLISKLLSKNASVLKNQNVVTHDFWVPLPSSGTKKICVRSTHQPIIIKGETIGVAIEFFDITTQKNEYLALSRKATRAEQERKTASLYLDRIIAHLPNNVFWVDRNSANLGCNDNVVKTLGVKSRKDLRGLTYNDMAKLCNWPLEQVGDQIKMWREDDIEVMRTGHPKESLHHMIGPDGNLIYQISTRVPLRDEDENIIGVIGVSTDITDRIQIENQLREAKEKAEIANQAKSDFLATISHELRTPLNGVLGMADILIRLGLKREQKIFTQDIINSGKTLLSLINGILDISKLEAGELEIINIPFNLLEIVDSTYTQILTQASDKKLKLLINIPEEIPTNLIGDSQRLYQILINLLGNAVKFTDEGTVEISVKCIEKSKRKIKLAFVISDTGIGIPKDKLKVIFDRFRQLDSSYSKRHSGTGLGLDIVNHLVDLMHGDIHVESTHGKGSTFTATLTFGLQPDNKSESPWQQLYSNIQILIIDDNLITGRRILQLINTPSVKLVSKSIALETLEKAAKRNQHYQILITANNGFCRDEENAKKLKSFLPHLHNPMIINYWNETNPSEEKDELAHDIIDQHSSETEFTNQLIKSWKQYKLRHEKENTDLMKLNSKILLVEDNLINQRVTTQMLKELKCKVDIADNGFNAIDLFKSGEYDLILMDIGLPDMDGYEVTQKIRQLENNENHIPIIAVTAYASANDKQKCLNAGMDSVITKPIDRAGLLNMLTNCLL